MNDRTNPPTAEAPIPEPKKGSVANFLKKTGLTALLALIAFTIFLGASHEGRAAVKATLFIPHVLTQASNPLTGLLPPPWWNASPFPSLAAPARAISTGHPAKGHTPLYCFSLA